MFRKRRTIRLHPESVSVALHDDGENAIVTINDVTWDEAILVLTPEVVAQLIDGLRAVTDD